MLGQSVFELPSHPSWCFDPRLLETQPNVTDSSSSDKGKDDKAEAVPFSFIPAGTVDIARVRQAYDHHAVPGYEIGLIEVIDNPNLHGAFEHYLGVLNARHGNFKYQPTWGANSHGQALTFRQSIETHYQTLSAAYQSAEHPHVHLLPLWHGTSDYSVEHFIAKGGYGMFTDVNHKTDEGFFGVGIYSTYEAEYAFRYATRHGNDAVLVMNWMSFFTAYPVIDGDMPKIRGQRGGVEQCDAHFVLVRSDNHHQQQDEYYPCGPQQTHHYTEVVVFNEAQCLPRYRVKLRRLSIGAPMAMPLAQSHEAALAALASGNTGQLAGMFAHAAQLGNPASAVRLHWLYASDMGNVVVVNSAQLPAITQAASAALPQLLPYAAPMTHNQAEAQFLVGWCYANGLGVEKDEAKAVEYYWLAAEQNHRDAPFELAQCCSLNQGVVKDINQAVSYYDKAAKLQHARASYALMVIYTMGLGKVAPDLVLAAQHQATADAGGYPQRLQDVEACFNQGVAYEKAKTYEQAAIRYYAAMDKGHTKARTNLGMFFLSGRGQCQKQPKKAFELWQQSANEGHARAMTNLSALYRKGKGTEKDSDKAAYWEEQAKSAPVLGGK